MNDDWTTFEQMSAGDLRRLADQMGSYDVVAVRVAPRLSPLAASAQRAGTIAAVLNYIARGG